MAATYMLRKHLRSMELAGRPEATRERNAHIEAANRARAELKGQFPLITEANFGAANRYHQERLAFWREQLS